LLQAVTGRGFLVSRIGTGVAVAVLDLMGEVVTGDFLGLRRVLPSRACLSNCLRSSLVLGRRSCCLDLVCRGSSVLKRINILPRCLALALAPSRAFFLACLSLLRRVLGETGLSILSMGSGSSRVISINPWAETSVFGTGSGRADRMMGGSSSAVGTSSSP